MVSWLFCYKKGERVFKFSKKDQFEDFFVKFWKFFITRMVHKKNKKIV